VTALRDDALATLRAWHAPDAAQEQLRQAYVDHLDARPDGTERECHPAHLTAGALVLSADRTQVLLTLHAKARRWFHLGGHCEPGDATLLAAARREGIEESGIDGLVLDPEPLHLDRHTVVFCGGHERVDHLDVRFLALAAEGASPTVSDESIDVRWWPVGDLPTDEPDMRRMVELALARAQTSSAAI
jgi:8-oxo-dGTP pyrophosphatase MutT (NUDIX family)